jgi:DNA-binding transcriptional LysR family regulator
MHSASTLLNRLLARGKFRHIQVLVKLAELGSVQRTADTIGMTQSAVTQTLAYLERLLETELFERHARGVRPTSACADLLPVARNMLLRLRQGAELVAARGQHGEGSVRMMGSASAINGMLLRALPAFTDHHPDIQTQLIEAEGDDLLLAMSRGEVDLVACRQRAAVPEGWQFHPLLSDRFAILCVPTHPLASMRHVTIAALARQTWLLAPAGSPLRMSFDELASRFPKGPSVYPVVSRWGDLVLTLLNQRELVTFLSLSRVGHLIDNGMLCEVNFGEAMPLEPLGIMVPLTGMSDAAEAMAGFLLEMFGEREAEKR